MIRLAKIISTSIASKVRSVKFYWRGKSDVRNSEEFSPFGIDGNPLKDMVAICVQTGQDGKTFVVGYLNKNQLAEPGELRLFSLDSTGAEKTYQFFKKDGTIEILGNTDNMVRYSALETAFNRLKGDHNTAVTSYNTFCAAVSLLTGIPFSPVALSAADITPAKIVEIKTKK